MKKKSLDDQICMSWLNQKNKEIRCHRKTCEKSDFCQYHKKYSRYMQGLKNITITNDCIDNDNESKYKKKIQHEQISSKYLDENFLENLLGIHESWEQVPENYWIKLNNKWWDIRILLDIFSNQLIASEMENPRPIYPNDPFTRKNFLPEELLLFKNNCKKNNLKIYTGLSLLLNSDLDAIYNKDYATSCEMSSKIINILSKKLRFKLICNKNSQDCYIGYWVPQNWQYSSFEELYKFYNSLSFQICLFENGNNIVFDNIDKINIKKIIDNLIEEDFNLNSDDICVYL